MDLAQVRGPLSKAIEEHIQDLILGGGMDCPRDCWSAIREGVNPAEDAIFEIGWAVVDAALDAIPAKGLVSEMAKGALGAVVGAALKDDPSDEVYSALAEALGEGIFGKWIPDGLKDVVNKIGAEQLKDHVKAALDDDLIEILDIDGHAAPARIRMRHCYAKIRLFFNPVNNHVVAVGRCVPGENNRRACCRGTFIFGCDVDEDGNPVARTIFKSVTR